MKSDVVAKLMKIWEAKAAKRAAKATGFTLMAVSLAACNDDAADAVLSVTAVDAQLPAFAGETKEALVDAIKTSNDADIAAAVDITSDNAAAILAAVTDVDATATSVAEVASNAAAAVDVTSNDADAILAAVTDVDATATSVAEVASNATTAALTDASGVNHADVDTAITSNDATIASNATTAALTDASGVNHADVDTAITSNDVTVAAEAVAPVQAELDALEADLAPLTGAVLTANADLVLMARGASLDGTSATLGANDAIIGLGDNTLNLTLTAINDAATIRGVETINADWNAFGTAAFDATNVDGAEIVLTSSRLGFLGSATITAAGSNTITGSTGMTGTLTVNGASTSIVNAGLATTVAVTAAGTAAANDTLVLNAGANTATITVSDFDSATINAGTATTLTLNDDNVAADDGNTYTVTIGANVAITNNVDDLVLIASAGGLTATVDEIDASLVIGGDLDVNLNFVDLNTLDDEIVTGNIGTITSTGDVGGATDLTNVAATNYVLRGANEALTLNSGTTVTLEVDGGANSSFTVGAAGGSDTLNLILEASQTVVNSDAEITTITVAADAVANAADITITALTGGQAYVFAATSNDFNVDGVVASSVNAAAVTGAFDLDQGAAAALAVTGSATAANTISLTGTTHASSYAGGAGNDTVDVATSSGSFTGTLDNGINSVVAAGLTTGNLVVVGGTGADTVTAGAITTANVTLELGGGNNVISLGLGNAMAAANIVVVTGGGNDTISLGNTAATTNLNINLGDGVNTLVIGAGANISAGTQNIVGVDVIDMVGGGAASTVAASLVSGTTINVTATNAAGDIFTVVGTTAAGETINLSGLVMDQSITGAVRSTDITGNAGADVIVGTNISDVIVGGGGNDTITGGLGADSMTGGTGSDTFVFATSADTGTVATGVVDRITDFTTAADVISGLGVAGNAAGEFTAVAGTTTDTYADALAAANAVFNAVNTQSYFLTTFGTDGNDAQAVLFLNMDNNATADGAILIGDAGDGANQAAALALLVATDIIA